MPQRAHLKGKDVDWDYKEVIGNIWTEMSSIK